MSDDFTKAVCEAVQDLYLGSIDGDYRSYVFCQSCEGESPPNSIYPDDIVHKGSCIVPLALEYSKTPRKKIRKTCGFQEAWAAVCTTEQPCSKHMSILCSTTGCSATATYSCDHTSFLVCGAPHCSAHRCNHAR